MGIIHRDIWDTHIPFDAMDDNCPILLISETKLSSTAKQFIQNFPGHVSYAVKANSDKTVIDILHKSGVQTFDVASTEEMATVKSAAPFATLHYHNPVRSREEVYEAIHRFNCRRFSVDHIGELEKLNSLVTDPGKVEIAVRFDVSEFGHAIQDFGSKFGAREVESIELLRCANDLGYMVGMTFHPGSQTLSPEPYEKCIKHAAHLANSAQCELKFLNVGGGFPSQYASSSCFDMNQFFNSIGESTDQAFPDSKPKLECEPGRGLVAPAATLITRIKSVRPDRSELFLNDGIYGGLMEASQFPELFPRYTHCALNSSSIDNRAIAWKAFGPTCDPVDVLPCALQLPTNINEGDLISFHGLGAYCNATATRFNGYGKIRTIIQAA